MILTIQNVDLKEENGQWIAVIKVNANDVEFANELGTKNKQVEFQTRVRELIKKKFPTIKIQLVKVMVGSMLIGIIPLSQNEAKAHETSFNMSYLYFGSTQSYLDRVDKTKGNLEVASPSFFDINEDGSLKLSKQFDPFLVQELKRKGLRVVPFLSNHWSRSLGVAALENPKELASEIAQAINAYNLDGVNVDIENVTEKDRDAYVELVKELRQLIPPEKEVSVAVVANPNGWNKGWHGSYDYEQLAKYSDYLMIMSYDEHYNGSEPGPIASYSFVERSVQYALKQGVPSEKIVLGLPFFGRYWIEGQPNKEGGKGISNVRVEQLLNKYSGVVKYDEQTKSPVATVTIKPNDPVTTIAGQALQHGTYHIYYENNESIREKMKLVHKYNLKGTGSWSLGQEDENIWNSFHYWMKGHDSDEFVAPTKMKTNYLFAPFTDIKGHWASENIKEVFQRGWMTGTNETQFNPDEKLTRAQAAVVLVRALNIPYNEAIKTFNDVAPTHWARHEISLAFEKGIIKGVSDTNFAPDKPVTREQMAVMLNRILISNSSGNKAAVFRDIDSSRWSYFDIQQMSSSRIFGGYPDETFRPEETITRAQMAALLSRTALQLDEIKEANIVLMKGSSGEEVKKLQSDLRYLGFFDENTTLTGYYGPITEEAVKAFQLAYRLSVDGIAGKNTLSVVKQVIEEKEK